MKLFGTDGIRGIPGRYPLDPETLRRVSRAVGENLLSEFSAKNGAPPLAVLGQDSRASGPRLASLVATGLSGAGLALRDAGVISTPAVSHLTRRLGAVLGVSVSASHNPARFNGVKFFSSDGLKLTSEKERLIEEGLASPSPRTTRLSPLPAPRFPFESLQPRRIDSAAELYSEFLRSTLSPYADLRGLKLVVDCANGAASRVAPEIFRSLGASVLPMACKPDGQNINLDCGALHPESMRRQVLKSGADCGVAFDGDADRVLLSDERGRLWDGDAIMGFCALRLKSLGLLRRDAVVTTVMSNYGFLKFLKENGISNLSVPVGDRCVSEALAQADLSLGGEPSGHVVFRDLAGTGDGLLTALQVLGFARESGRPLSALKPAYSPVPQVILNVPSSAKPPLEDLPGFQKILRHWEKALEGRGRVLARYSGTEPILRIMVEAPEAPRVRMIAKALSGTYRKETQEEEAVHEI